jgi:hypothetical protein
MKLSEQFRGYNVIQADNASSCPLPVNTAESSPPPPNTPTAADTSNPHLFVHTHHPD